MGIGAWVLDRLIGHAQVCLDEIPLRLKMRTAHSTDGKPGDFDHMADEELIEHRGAGRTRARAPAASLASPEAAQGCYRALGKRRSGSVVSSSPASTIVSSHHRTRRLGHAGPNRTDHS